MSKCYIHKQEVQYCKGCMDEQRQELIEVIEKLFKILPSIPEIHTMRRILEKYNIHIDYPDEEVAEDDS